jgi:hypothetical protein
MEFIVRVFFLFTPYTDAREQAAARFFKRLTERSNRTRTRAKLLNLLQRDIAVINLWTEYQYKGYRYLRKSQRKKLYANLQLIAEDFERFTARHTRPAHAVVSHVHQLAPQATVDPERLLLLQKLMDYFSPARGVYEYRISSSFGRLLRDPSRERLVGDCNQIVTLYLYLYSRYYDIRDLQIRALPEHVALHYGGIDIEATTGTFANYSRQKGGRLVPVEEIVSINLLDATDAYLSKHEVAARALLQESRIAFILSHERDIVTHNLDTAYHRQVNALMERGKYRQALKFAIASGNTTLQGLAGHNGAVHEMEHHNYAAARRFARHAAERDTLIRSIWHTEGVHYYQKHRYKDAITAFKHINDKALIRQCYEQLFFEEQKRLKTPITTESVKTQSGTVKRMRTYAKKSGNKKLITYANSLSR